MAQVELPNVLEPEEVNTGKFLEKNPNLKLRELMPLPLFQQLSNVTPSSQDLLNRHRDGEFKEAYKMTSQPRGRCLIINNRTFSHKAFRERRGTDDDRDDLKDLFKSLHYHVEVVENLSADDIVSNCSMFILDRGFEHFDSCALCILSHGEEQNIVGSDGKTVDESEILNLFNDPKCKLHGKPKLVIIQACRTTLPKSLLAKLLPCIGVNTLDVRVETEDGTDLEEITNQMREDFMVDDGELKKLKKAVSPAVVMHDIIIARSTLPGELSWRNTNHGSWFIQALVKVFNARKDSEHVADLLVMVKRVCEEAFSGLQVPCIASHLSKKFYFFPNAR